jgi:TM2 domain-containing membrane protein YozV
MIGHIESYNKDVQTGVIKYEGKFYEFYIDVWTSEQPPKSGDDVDFLLAEDDTVTEVGLLGAYVKDIRPVKWRILACVLAFVLGWLGIHRFYLGFYSIGIAQVMFTGITMMLGFGVGFGMVWGFVEGFLLITGHFAKDGKGRTLK